MDVTQAALVAESLIFAAAMASRLRMLRMSEQALGRRTRELVEVLGTDALTGAANRAGLGRRAGAALEAGEPFALMLLDLDGFKAVNDTHGHQTGDAVLRHLAGLIAGCVRSTDFVARFGGEEFVVLLPEPSDREEGRLVAEKIRIAVGDAPFPGVG
ncbi:GGDEF domain-containing protein, partial [Rhizobium sp. 18065]|uniref:GGDEF domain-containing protein n=1 Tax=Rhizobium sp. 18065 TaxID=2681411 RepID=UPI00190F9E3B